MQRGKRMYTLDEVLQRLEVVWWLGAMVLSVGAVWTLTRSSKWVWASIGGNLALFYWFLGQSAYGSRVYVTLGGVSAVVLVGRWLYYAMVRLGLKARHRALAETAEIDGHWHVLVDGRWLPVKNEDIHPMPRIVEVVAIVDGRAEVQPVS